MSRVVPPQCGVGWQMSVRPVGEDAFLDLFRVDVAEGAARLASLIDGGEQCVVGDVFAGPCVPLLGV